MATAMLVLFGCADANVVELKEEAPAPKVVRQRDEVPTTIDPRNLEALTGGGSGGAASNFVSDPDGLSFNSVIAGPSIITNGTIGLGVNPTGNLNIGSSIRSLGGTYAYGLRFLPTGAEATAPGCLCEGWGVGDLLTGVQGSANVAVGGVQNLVVESFDVTASTAVSVVRAANKFRVTHNYHPTTLTTFLYEVEVTIENISGTVADVIYRRVMDWDIEPTPFSELVTIQRGSASAIYRTDNNGFNPGNPFSFSSYGLLNVNFVDAGPRDHGALFDFRFPNVQPGQKIHFRTFYGAANTEGNALLAIGAAQIEAYSLGQTNFGGTTGAPNTFIFGFGGVGGAPVQPPNVPPVFATPSVCSSTIPAVLGANVNFSVSASDANATNTVTLSAVSKPASATFPTVTGNPVSSTFNWLINQTGNHLVSISAKDNAGAETLCNVTISVPTNIAPVANAGPDQTVNLVGSPMTSVSLDGTGSTDDGQVAPLTYTWKEGATTLGTGATLSVNLGIGAHTITLTVFDGALSHSDVVVITVVDPTPPVITSVVAGTLGTNGWYTSAVTVTWTVSDPESALTSAPCAAQTQTADIASQTFSCSATSAGGTSSKSETFKKDGTNPTIAFAGSLSYTVDQTVSITCSAADNLSGVASSSCGTPVASGAAYTFPLGSNTGTATALDNAGNPGSGSVVFTVNVTYVSLCALVKLWVTQHGVAHSLCVKLEHAQRDGQNYGVGKYNHLSAFIHEVEAQTGKHVPADKAPILIALAKAL